MAASKRADPGRSTLSSAALAGGSNTNPHKELMMQLNTMAPADDATGTHVLILTKNNRRLGPGAPLCHDVTYDGQPVVTRSTNPMLDACRILLAWGFTGTARFESADGVHQMSWDIEKGAKLTVRESGDGLRFSKYRPADACKVIASGRNDAAATEVVEA